MCACSRCLSVQSFITQCNENANTTIFLFFFPSHSHKWTNRCVCTCVCVFVCGPVLNRPLQRLHICSWLHTLYYFQICRVSYEIIQLKSICWCACLNVIFIRNYHNMSHWHSKFTNVVWICCIFVCMNSPTHFHIWGWPCVNPICKGGNNKTLCFNWVL